MAIIIEYCGDEYVLKLHQQYDISLHFKSDLRQNKQIKLSVIRNVGNEKIFYMMVGVY